jgi:hypothetical protein
MKVRRKSYRDENKPRRHLAEGAFGNYVRPTLRLTFDQDVFDAIRAIALVRGTPFSVIAREVLRAGLPIVEREQWPALHKVGL